MKTTVTYVFPVSAGAHYLERAVRFLTTYAQFHPGMEHDTVIACNGGEPLDEIKFMFQSMPNVQFMVRDNSGYDIGAFQQAAREYPCDLMVFFGATTYLKGTGWLVRMVEAYAKWGHALYGVMGNRGNRTGAVAPHIRTTGWWMSPALLNQYPATITTENRYAFEHGPNCLTSWIYKRKLRAWVVGWKGEYEQPLWDSIENGYHRGNQSNLLCGDKNSEPPYYAVP